MLRSTCTARRPGTPPAKPPATVLATPLATVLATPLAVAALTLSLAACGNATVPVATQGGSTTSAGSTSMAPTTTTPATAAATTSTRTPTTASTTTPAPPATATGAHEAPQTLVVDGRTIVGVPPHWTFPAGSSVGFVSTDATGGTVLLTAPAGADLIAHFRQMLPRTGYDITVDVGTQLVFAGRGWSGTIVGHSSGPGGQLVFSVDDRRAAPTTPPAAGEPSPQTARDLGLTNVPFFMRYPAAVRATGVSDPVSGASYTLTGRPGADIAAFYRTYLPQGHFTITADTTSAGVTTIEFTEDDFTSTLVTTADGARLTHRRT